MTYHNAMLRPAMTAIAAVIALSSTPLFAQSADTPAPIVESTPAPAPAAPDPLAPDVTATSSTAEPVASETKAAPAATARKTTRVAKPAPRAPATRSTATRGTSVTRTVAATPVAATVPVPAPVEGPAPVAVEPGPVPVAEPAPVAADGPVVANGLSMDEALPIAGAGALGLLALAGTGLVMRRRRRRREDAIHEAKWQQIEAAPESAFEPDPAPTFARTPMAEAAPVAVAATTAAASNLPEGFDVSRFGPHVQAAYRGPTEDNPSLSLKRRLAVGHFLDKKVAETGSSAVSAAAPSEPAKAQPARPAWAASTNNDFLLRRADKKPVMRPAYQK